MLKVFLVEDEFTVREKMKKNINWGENGFGLVGEASDGEVAYPMIMETQPDIIITDIKMPFMDGLALSRLVKEKMPKVKIIILSGYDEFDYAKEAINIGITDYLLKPIAAKKLMESLKSVQTMIEKEKEQENYEERFRIKEKESIENEKKHFFNEMISYKLPPSELIEKARKLGLDLSAPMYNVLLVKVLLEEGQLNDYKSIHEQLNQKMNGWCMAQKQAILFEREGEEWIFLLKSNGADIEHVEESSLQAIQDMVEGEFSYCIGVGKRVTRLSEICNSFDAASKAIAYRYLLIEEHVIYYDKLDHYNIMPEHEEVSIKDVDVTKFDKRTIDEFLKCGMKEQVPQFVTAYLTSIGSGTNSILFRQYIMMDIYFIVVAFVEQLGYKADCILEICGDIKEMSKVIQSKEASQHYLEILLSEALSLRNEISSKKYSHLLDEAKSYIEENYSNEEISLSDVAQYVNISPSHFSTIFSQEVGQTFISYLTEIRMKKAKELLCCSNMKTLEVGYAVGYKDPHYFSYLFKKTQNCTTKEYREMNVKKGKGTY